MIVSDEVFTKEEISCAIERFLDYGEEEFGKSQRGYFSGDGWAARCLRYHLRKLKEDEIELPAERLEMARPEPKED